MAKKEEFIATQSKRLIDEMGFVTRTTQRWRNKLSDQLLFHYEAEQIQKYRNKAKRGLIKVGTELETLLEKDIKDWLLKKQKDEKLAIEEPPFLANIQEQREEEEEEKKSEKQLKEEAEAEERKQFPQLEDMQRTQSYIKTRAGASELLSAFLEILISNARFIACILMIIAHLINGALLTLFYPFAVFSYALLEETRPAKWFWNLVIYYTLVFVFIRFAT